MKTKMISDNFDATSWMMVSLVGINASAFSIFIFEWLSPAGHDRKVGRTPLTSSRQQSQTVSVSFALRKVVRSPNSYLLGDT